MSDATITNACNQRKMSMLFNIPPVRFNPISPYSKGFTYEQLNMRRKVEVLKYNKQNTQTSQLTKKEKQAMVSRGNYKGNQLFCTDDYAIPTPTSSSDVPGPITYLSEDKNVPLYNYVSNTFVYAIGNPIEEEEWSFYTRPEVVLPSGLNNITNVGTLLIRDTIEQPLYTYNYKIPVVYQLQGVNIPYDTSGIIMNVSITNPTAKIYYGSNEIANNVSSTTFENSTYQVSLQPDSSITSGTYSYSGQLYTGLVEVSNMQLMSSPGFSYNIGISYTASESIDYTNSDTNNGTTSSIDQTTLLDNTTFSMVANIDNNYTITAPTNCNVFTTASTSLKTIQFSGE
jgi:hypothetical protein